MDKLEKFRKTLMQYHDEIADLKSYFDGQGSDSFDEQKLFTLSVIKPDSEISTCNFPPCLIDFIQLQIRKVKSLQKITQKIEAEPCAKIVTSNV